MVKTAVAPESRDMDRWEPIVLTFDYEWHKCGPCAEPCIFPCCCCYFCSPCGKCYAPMTPCMSQRDKGIRAHNRVHEAYARDGVYGKGAICVSFVWEETEKGLKMIEIFRNVDAAEAYYTHFMSDKVFVLSLLANLPFRQKAGPTAACSDGNVKAYVTVPSGGMDQFFEIGKQTSQYNHLKDGKCPIEKWETAPSKEELEEQFGKFHFGFITDSTLAETDTGAKPGDAPPQQTMK
ncbi:unnamed protein product [Amoebophrya sp. A25]|nr:unnamed protein product [Amoebophrya sp. A25]|eukprot:GSA25T00003587001.1